MRDAGAVVHGVPGPSSQPSGPTRAKPTWPSANRVAAYPVQCTSCPSRPQRLLRAFQALDQAQHKIPAAHDVGQGK